MPHNTMRLLLLPLPCCLPQEDVPSSTPSTSTTEPSQPTDTRTSSSEASNAASSSEAGGMGQQKIEGVERLDLQIPKVRWLAGLRWSGLWHCSWRSSDVAVAPRCWCSSVCAAVVHSTAPSCSLLRALQIAVSLH